MQCVWLTIIGAALAILAPVAWAEQADPEKLQGKWTVESCQYNGAPVDQILGATREFKLEQYTLMPKAGDTYSGTFKLDQSKTPKQIDLEVNGRTLKGIYELGEDTLKIAYRLEGDERPAELVSKPDSGIVLMVHKRAP